MFGTDQPEIKRDKMFEAWNDPRNRLEFGSVFPVPFQNHEQTNLKSETEKSKQALIAEDCFKEEYGINYIKNNKNCLPQQH